MKKTNAKNINKPSYVIDITWCNDLYDTAIAIAYGKQRGGQPLTDEDIDIINTLAMDTFGDVLDSLGYIHKENHFISPVINTMCVCAEDKKVKKPNIFKRIWNWLFGKKD